MLIVASPPYAADEPKAGGSTHDADSSETINLVVPEPGILALNMKNMDNSPESQCLNSLVKPVACSMEEFLYPMNYCLSRFFSVWPTTDRQCSLGCSSEPMAPGALVLCRKLSLA
jgi:hypothetical protein